MVDGGALGFIWQALMSVGREGRGVELCSQKLNLAAVSVDPGRTRWADVGPEQGGAGRVDTGGVQSQNQ